MLERREVLDEANSDGLDVEVAAGLIVDDSETAVAVAKLHQIVQEERA